MIFERHHVLLILQVSSFQHWPRMCFPGLMQDGNFQETKSPTDRINSFEQIIIVLPFSFHTCVCHHFS
jgi:hypothetical protein